MPLLPRRPRVARSIRKNQLAATILIALGRTRQCAALGRGHLVHPQIRLRRLRAQVEAPPPPFLRHL
eukprot:9207669-Alexandrium_andersonii.AAC.1